MRYGITVLIATFLLIIGVVIVVSRIGEPDSQTNTTSAIKTAEYADNNAASVSWTMQGEIVGNDEYNSVRITVTNSKRTAEILNGYEYRLVKSEEFTNNKAAFDTFTRAIDNLGFGTERDVAVKDERGVCPQGNRFVYILTDGTKQIMRTWSDTCSTKTGTSAIKNTSAVRKLFQAQITNYSEFVSCVEF